MGKGIKLIVADDNRNLCQMLQNYLQGQEDLNIVGVDYFILKPFDLEVLGKRNRSLAPEIPSCAPT